MRKGDFLKTAMINEFEYEEFFRSLMQEGRNVIFLDMSREMSSSFVNAGLAAQNIREEFPEQTLYIMDTLCISGGLGLLVEQMVMRKEQGMGFEEVIAWGEENKLKIAHRFTVDDLNYLKAGGRVSNASALVGSLLNIKPVLYVPDKGTLDVVKKARGRKAALKSMLDGVIHDLSESGAEGREIHILQADCREDAEKIRDRIKAAFPGVGNITITSLGVVIGAHCGPGLLTVFYLCGGRRPE
jgi:DegV family protein with EDD domain